MAQRPWDPDAARRLAVAQAEDQQFVPALETLRYLASQSVNKIPVLIYTEVNPCAYPGGNSSLQVVAHLEELARPATQFTVPGPGQSGRPEAGNGRNCKYGSPGPAGNRRGSPPSGRQGSCGRVPSDSRQSSQPDHYQAIEGVGGQQTLASGLQRP